MQTMPNDWQWWIRIWGGCVACIRYLREFVDKMIKLSIDEDALTKLSRLYWLISMSWENYINYFLQHSSVRMLSIDIRYLWIKLNEYKHIKKPIGFFTSISIYEKYVHIKEQYNSVMHLCFTHAHETLCAIYQYRHE